MRRNGQGLAPTPLSSWDTPWLARDLASFQKSRTPDAVAGEGTRVVIGTVILWDILAATVFTLVVPVACDLLARTTGSPGEVKRRLEAEMEPQAGGRER